MTSARVQVRSSGVLSVQPSPLTDASKVLVDLALASGYQSGTWTRSSMADTVSGVSYTALVEPPDPAKIFALRIKSGAAIKVRVTYESSGAQVCPVGSSLLLTPPEDDRLTLIEVASVDASLDSEIAWCVIV